LKIITPTWKNNVAIIANNGKLPWMKFIPKLCIVCILSVCMFLSLQALFADAKNVPSKMDITMAENKETGKIEYQVIYLLQSEEAMDEFETEEYNIDARFVLINPDDRRMAGYVASDEAIFVSDGIQLKAVLPWKPKEAIIGISIRFKHKSDSAKDSKRFELKPVIEDKEIKIQRHKNPAPKQSSGSGPTALV